jgi:hypothetical protein
MSQHRTAEVSEAEIAVHWQEEGYVNPLFSLSTISPDVFLGAPMPCQVLASKPGTDYTAPTEVERRPRDPRFRPVASPSRRGLRRQYRATTRPLPPIS